MHLYIITTRAERTAYVYVVYAPNITRADEVLEKSGHMWDNEERVSTKYICDDPSAKDEGVKYISKVIIE